MGRAKEAMQYYNGNRTLLISLGIAENDSVFRELKSSELWCRNYSKPRQLGDNEEEPWYWRVGKPAGLSDEQENEWVLEMQRVKWFRDRATLDRWKEEKEIVEEEYRRVQAFHSHMRDVWKRLAEARRTEVDEAGTSSPSPEGCVGSGYASYARKQAAVYERLRADSEHEWAKREKVRPPRKRYDATPVSSVAREGDDLDSDSGNEGDDGTEDEALGGYWLEEDLLHDDSDDDEEAGE